MSEHEPIDQTGGETWAREALERVALAAITEQRRARRWGIFFKGLGFLYLTVLVLVLVMPLLDSQQAVDEKHTALVSIEGVIASDAEANADDIVQGLRAAFEDDNTAGIVLAINSPGGSPVQAGQVYNEILRLRAAHPDKPLYAVVSDVCASGGYYIAAAAQAIYADKASLVGSIGVRSDGFGFVEALDKLGIERRLYTAGANKGLLDPFRPENPEEVQYLQNLLGEVHQQFIDAVRQGRGDRLRETPELYSGLIWTGEKSQSLGLIDALGTTRSVAEEVIKAKRVVDYTRRPNVLEQALEQIGVQAGGALAEALGLRAGLY